MRSNIVAVLTSLSLFLPAISADPLPIEPRAVNGRCSGSSAVESGGWTRQCICLTANTCRSYGGRPFSTWKEISPHDGYPCPWDSDDILGCDMGGRQCAGYDWTTCWWADACRSVDNIVLSNPTCPGGNDFVCCQHT
ncbi:hypothetical protein B0I37DRAFT_449530 [Chaetomium sp. MPI-CAGE-AT-0009]|nr:hypothetical protein B0I37DRAFT_449530 [Chaetomium sp. MPI-CAGE-AT-0009]